MKNLRLVIGFIVILTLVCSPALAISSSDLIAQYRGQSATTIPTVVPTTTPTTAPTQVLTGFSYTTVSVTSTPTPAMVFIDGSYEGLTPFGISGLSVGTHHLRVSLPTYEDYLTEIVIPEPECHMVWFGHLEMFLCDTPSQTIDVTLKKIESTQKPTIPTFVRPTTPTTPTPTTTPTFIPTTMPTQAPSNSFYPIYYPSADRPCEDCDPSSYNCDLCRNPVPTQAPGSSPGAYATYIKIKSSSLDSIFRPPYPDGPIKKPNIYLYSDRDLTAQVQLTPEKAITVSEPAYQPGKGWLAQIRDGSLNGNGDFLFYEAIVPDSGWQKEEGYVIRAAYREQDMAAMLGPYGFNEKETVEFIEYWASHLIGDVDYVFYPKETDAVERVMPLSVSPKPDHVMRIWFYAEPLVSAPEPVTHPEKIVREGFYIVEWGVFINDEYWINHSAASSEVVL